jgi:hypothetical protein
MSGQTSVSLNWPKQSAVYCDGFDDNRHWLPEVAYEKLQDCGYIVQLGQVGPFVQRLLDRFVKQGVLVKYRGHWDTTLTFAGMGPLKTIWATPEYVEQLPGVNKTVGA